MLKTTHWFVDPKGSFVYYSENGKKGRRFYDKTGNFVYNILSYSEESLPSVIRDRVKQTYLPGLQYHPCTRDPYKDQLIYLIQITDKKTWKKLRVTEDEMDVFAEQRIQR
jgi:hypothetical protein